mgnify:CR=1 FL=1
MAPTDDAFNRLGNDTVAKLLQNPTLLASKLPVCLFRTLSCGNKGDSNAIIL